MRKQKQEQEQKQGKTQARTFCLSFKPAGLKDAERWNVGNLSYFKCWRASNRPCTHYYSCKNR